MRGLRRGLSISLLCVVLGLCASPAYAAVVVGWVAPGATEVDIGDTVRARMAIGGFTGSAGSSLGLFDLDVSYSATSLRFLGGTFAPDGPATNPLALPEAGAPGFLGDFLDAAGLIDVFGLSGNSQAVLDSLQPDSFVLFELVFEAIGVDPAAFVRLELNDPLMLFGSSMSTVTLSPTFDPAGLTFRVVPSSGSVPEPSSALLAGLALLGLCACRARAAPAEEIRMRLIPKLALAAAALTALLGMAQSQPAPSNPPVDGGVVHGVVVQVIGGRVTLRTDSGAVQTFSSMPGTVQPGQRIQAQTRRVGDSVRLERIELKR